MILVTGATGLVGGNLIWQLLQHNGRVTAIRRRSSNMELLRTIFSFYTSTPDEFLSRIDWVIADILDKDSIQLAMKGISIIYHCAAVISFDRNGKSMLDTNVTGTRNVVRAAIDNRIGKLCFVSSIAACGRPSGNELVNENSVWGDTENRSLYSRSKYYSEQEIWKGIHEGLNAVIVNPGVILGVSGTNSGSSQLLSQVQKGLMFYTSGGSGYVDVRDVVKAMILLMESDISGERFILIGENCSNKDILCWMADGFGKRRPFIGVGKRILWVAGLLAELLAILFRFQPLVNRAIALTATSLEYYSNRKMVEATGFKFASIHDSILEICHFLGKSKN